MNIQNRTGTNDLYTDKGDFICTIPDDYLLREFLETLYEFDDREQQIEDLEEKIEDLKEKIEDLEEKIEDLEEKIDTLEIENTELKEKIDVWENA